MISVITTNIFPNKEVLDLSAKCLSMQTCQDYQWVFLDGHYLKNKKYFEDLCLKYKIKNYIHGPLCKANHVGRLFHWEVYNNSLLLCDYDLILRFGTYRWLDKNAIENVIYNAQKGIYLDFPHNTINLKDFNNNDLLNPSYNNEIRDFMQCSAGMFSYSKSRLLEMNGNNEASTLLVHHEDSDLNSRWTHIRGIKSKKVNNAMFRFEHEKSPVNVLSILEEGNSLSCKKEGCLASYPNTFHLAFNPPVQNTIFKYRDFDWIKCECCGTVSPIDADEYLEYLKIYDDPFGPVGVDGRVGRNLIILNNYLSKIKNNNDKFDLLKSSHTEDKFLKDENKKINILDLRNEFKEKIKEYCNNNDIKFIDRDLLSNQHIQDRKLNEKVEFKIFKYLLPHIKKYEKNIFIFELLQDVDDILDLNSIFENVNSENIYISMKHSKYPNISKFYKEIEWWDEYISNNKNIYSDAELSNEIRINIDTKYINYLNCFFCIKKRG